MRAKSGMSARSACWTIGAGYRGRVRFLMMSWKRTKKVCDSLNEGGSDSPPGARMRKMNV